MATIDLSSYQSIHTSVFVKITISDYGDLLLSDHYQDYTIGTDTYNGLGNVINLTEPTVELSPTNKKINLTLSGIPTGNRDLVLDYNIKGSPVTVTRAFFDSETGILIPVSGNPAVRFKGIVTNWSISEEFNVQDQVASNTISFQIASNLGLYRDKNTGRRTNPDDFTVDRSFERIPQLSNSNFNFGGAVK